METATNLTTFVANAMTCVTTVFTFITQNAELAVLAIGYPVVRMGASVLKRLIRV